MRAFTAVASAALVAVASAQGDLGSIVSQAVGDASSLVGQITSDNGAAISSGLAAASQFANTNTFTGVPQSIQAQISSDALAGSQFVNTFTGIPTTEVAAISSAARAGASEVSTFLFGTNGVTVTTTGVAGQPAETGAAGQPASSGASGSSGSSGSSSSKISSGLAHAATPAIGVETLALVGAGVAALAFGL